MLRNEQNSCFYSQTPAAEEEWPQSPVDSTEKWDSHIILLFLCSFVCLFVSFLLPFVSLYSVRLTRKLPNAELKMAAACEEKKYILYTLNT